MEQDPTFAYRIIIDIALKALSPAINDPTTAVLAIDQLHRLLRKVGKQKLRTDEILDKSGRLRVIFRTPNWEDFVHLTFSEIRQCGGRTIYRSSAVAGDDRKSEFRLCQNIVTLFCSANLSCSTVKLKGNT